MAEARYPKDGKWHGFEWWIIEDQRSVHHECHYSEDLRRGIERMWNLNGRLRRGYPKYWVRDRQITKRQYLRASSIDPTLQPFRERDNRPQRRLPREVAAHLVKAALVS